MLEFIKSYQSDVIIIGILVIEIFLLMILGVKTLQKSRSLSNIYFSIVFFDVVFLSLVNIVIRFLAIYIEKNGLGSNSTISQLYLDLVALVTIAMVLIPIFYGTAFFIINFGEKYYRDRKLYILFIILVIIISGLVISTRLLPDGSNWGINFEVREEFEEYFFFGKYLAITLGLFVLIFSGLDLLLLIRIFPDTHTNLQKRKLVTLMISLIGYFLGLANLIVVDMHLPSGPLAPEDTPIWPYIYITSVLFLGSVILLYLSVDRRKKVE